MKSVHVLFRCDRGENNFLPDVLGQRSLDENAMHARISVQLVDDLNQLGLARRLGEHLRVRPEAEARGNFSLHPDVNLRGGIFAHADKDEPGLDSTAL